MAARKKAGAAGQRKRASPGVPIPSGFVLKGVSYVSKVAAWRIGTNIGVGGFGVIFTASSDCDRAVADDASLVAKIEPYDNGPLFTEFHAMQRLSRPEYIDAWKKAHHLNFLGVPPLVGFGTVMYNNVKYRFIIMDRYGEDIHKLFQECGRRLPSQTVCNVGIKVVNVLEYMHSKGYTHNDIKGANLLIGYGTKKCDDVFLIDLGLARTYLVAGKHMEYRHDRRFAHNGTREFTCRDAHNGVTSRRGDLETLGYCLVLWEAGWLPWESETDDNKVHAEKNAAFRDTSAFLRKAFATPGTGTKKTVGHPVPRYLDEYFKLITGLTFEEEPDYGKIKAIFSAGLVDAGSSDRDGKLIFPCRLGRSVPTGPAKQQRRASNEENIETDERQKNRRPRAKPKRNRRSVSTSPRIPLRHKQRNPSPVKSGASSSSSRSTEREVDLMGTGCPLTPAALELVARHPHLKEKLLKKNDSHAASVPQNAVSNPGPGGDDRRDSSDFRRDSDLLEKRLQAGVHHQRVNSDAGRNSNTIAGCSPSPRIRAKRQNLPKSRLLSESSDSSSWSDGDEDMEITMSDLGQPTSHMMAVLSKSSNDGSTSGRSGSTRKGGKARSKLDLAECSSIPTPAMLEFMQSRPELQWKYAATAGNQATSSKKLQPKVVGVRSSPRLRARK